MRTHSALALLSAAVLVVGALLAPAPPAAQAGACAGPREPVVGVVPTVTDAIPSGEGILVHLVVSAQRSLGPAGDTDFGVASPTTYGVGLRLEREGEAAIPLRVEELGPSVARLMPARSPRAGRWRVVSQHGSVEITVGTAPAPPVGAAPHLVSMTTQTQSGSGPRGSWSSTSTTAVTQAPLGPPAWQGFVVFAASSPSVESPILAHAFNGAGATFSVYTTPGRCGFFTPGQNQPGGGELVRIAAYDLWGRLSARSNQVRVSR